MKNRFLVLLLVLFVPLFLAVPRATAAHSADSSKNEYVTARLLADVKAISPGKSFHLAVELRMKPGWHTYYKESGDAGLPTKIIWQLPPGFKNGSLLWEKPNKFTDSGITTYGYSDKTLIAAPITSPSNLRLGQSLNFGAQVEWLSCKDICVPGKAELHLTLPIIPQKVGDGTDYSSNTQAFAKVNFDRSTTEFNVLDANLTEQSQLSGYGKWFVYFACALLGGLLLNAMPCVLPVVAIKILSLLEQSKNGNTRSTTIAFTAGILSSFLFLGLLVIGLQAAGHKIGWGFQFQQPVFLMLMSCSVLLFALSLFGLFDLSISVGPIDSLALQKGWWATFSKVSWPLFYPHPVLLRF